MPVKKQTKQALIYAIKLLIDHQSANNRPRCGNCKFLYESEEGLLCWLAHHKTELGISDFPTTAAAICKHHERA